jgi:hypothetical protein
MSKKISALTTLTAPADGDLLSIVDVSDTTDAATGTTKAITFDNLIGKSFPDSSTDNAIARFNSTTGKLLQNSAVIIEDLGTGAVRLRTPSVSGIGNGFNIFGGDSSDNQGGGSLLQGGAGFGSYAGGISNLKGGVAGATGAGGAAIVEGGAGGATSGNGGNALIYGGDATAGDSDGGFIHIAPGTKSGSGAHGKILLIEHKGAAYGSFLDLSLIASSNKTFTFPNATGALALQTGVTNYAADAQANDTYVITLAPVPAAYVAGMALYFKANTANTTDATLNVNALGAKAIVKGVSTALSSNDILAGMMCHVVYDGTNFVLMNPRAL